MALGQDSRGNQGDFERNPQLARVYVAAGSEEPPAALDEALRAAARRAVSAGPAVAGAAPRARRNWYVPMSLAAVLVLSVSLVTLVREEKAGDLTQAPVQAPAPAPSAAPGPGPAPAPTPAPAPAPAVEAQSVPVSPPSTAERDARAQVEASAVATETQRAATRKEERVEPQAAAPEAAKKVVAPVGGAQREADVAPANRPQPAAPVASAAPPAPVAQGTGTISGVSGEARAPAAAPAAAPSPSVVASAPPAPAAAPRPAPPTEAKLSTPGADVRVDDSARTAERPATRGVRRDTASARGAARAPWLIELDNQPVEKWLERLAALRREERNADAELLLEEFRKRFPDHPASR